jgi:menaquinone-dependent protoporphyrinogen oxidase
MEHRVLVAYASRHGSTEDIAERLAATLRDEGIEATALAVDEIHDADGYDGYVIGSAVYAMHWLGEAKSFIHHHRNILRRHPVWLFSSGPLSSDQAEAERAQPRDVADLERDVNARAHRTFAGAWDREAPRIGVMEKVMGMFPAAREALPQGDFRDWPAIDEFARSIAGELRLALATA